MCGLKKRKKMSSEGAHALNYSIVKENQQCIEVNQEDKTKLKRGRRDAREKRGKWVDVRDGEMRVLKNNVRWERK